MVKFIAIAIISGVSSIYFGQKLSKYIPKTFQGKTKKEITQQYKTKIYFVNTMFLTSLISSAYLYNTSYFSEYDWKGVSFIFGFGLSTPLYIVLLYFLQGMQVNAKEFLFAYSISEKIPIFILLTVNLLGFCAFICSSIFYLLKLF